MIVKHLLRSAKKPTDQLGEDFLMALFDSLNDVIFVLNQQQQIQYINQHWTNLTGIDKQQVLGVEFSAFIHPEDRSKWQQSLQKLQTGSNQQCWLRIITQQHEIRWCEAHLQSMQTGTLYPISASLIDITPQIRQEQIQQANHRSLQSLVNRLPAMLYRSRNNKSWTMEYLSEGSELITGYPADALLNQSQVSLGSMIHADDRDPVWEQVQQALQTQTNFELTYRLQQANGQQINVRDKGRGLYSDSGMVLGVEGIIFQVE